MQPYSPAKLWGFAQHNLMLQQAAAPGSTPDKPNVCGASVLVYRMLHHSYLALVRGRTSPLTHLLPDAYILQHAVCCG